MVDDKQLVKEFEALKKKVQLLEDKEAIRDVLTRYAFNADLNRTENYVKLYTEDGAYITDATGKLVISRGKKAIGENLQNPVHQAITTRSQHLQLDYLIEVDGDTAFATGYQLLTQRWEGGYGIFRCAFRTFRFRRENGQWLITEARSVAIGQAECQQLVSTKY